MDTPGSPLRKAFANLLGISVLASLLVSALFLVAFWQNGHLRRADYEGAAGVACAVFWATLLFGGALLGVLFKGHDAYHNR